MAVKVQIIIMEGNGDGDLSYEYLAGGDNGSYTNKERQAAYDIIGVIQHSLKESHDIVVHQEGNKYVH
ncbi:hypothetical protein [Xenorhabdus cabanillasii]|uniref:Uncharacterized protein n=1 Tax=Xenorhabdus cabanillasii JM26 TaxID=1427517 RepID=W1IQ43_9GAMM|nr:hypothetical protein [Xenorhabdus cabanillasii]PHM78418.1 hypothetical protein Xcab_01034 [Xenorhabdus cabanillasii JM26]CDL79756.1 hypothetical protein XCR1_1220041 [Xenorhabdus cabanillasii JM26]